jgi:hypothetical protein
VVWRRNDTLITPPTTIFYMGGRFVWSFREEAISDLEKTKKV